MSRLHLFFPENDLALASGLDFYTPPPAAAALHRAGSCLPLWFASCGDSIAVAERDVAWLNDSADRFGIEASAYRGLPAGLKPAPWGWSRAARTAFRRLGFDNPTMPSDNALERLRMLSHRRTAIALRNTIEKIMLDAQLTQNSIVSRTDFDANTGAQTTTYQNVDGVWSVRLMNMFSLPLRNKAFTVNNHLFVNYASSVGFNNSQRNRSGSFSVSESFGMAWRPENVELELRPRYTFQNVSNSMQKNAAGNLHTYGGTFYATYNAPFGLVLSSDINFQATSGYSDGFDTRTWMWNASVGYQFLKGKAATVSLKAYDILGQRSNVRRSVTANYIDDQRYNSLQRYIMVTVAYRFNTFGRGQQPEVGGFDGPGGPGGPPRGRMHRGGPPM